MALPNIMRRLFRSDGYGPLLKPEIIPFASDLASKASDVAASTEWTKNLVVASVYVDDTLGSNSNDGFSANSPVKTISKGLEILSDLPTGSNVFTRLHIKSGAYTENVEFSNSRIIVELDGTVSITGKTSVIDYSYIVFNQISTGSLSITNTGDSVIFVDTYSSAVYNCTVNNSCSNSESCIYVNNNSLLRFNESITFNLSSVNYGCLITNNSTFISYSTLTATCTSVDRFFYSYNFCSIRIYSDTKISGDINICISIVRICYFLSLCDNLELYGKTVFDIDFNSHVLLRGYNTAKLYRTGGGKIILVRDSSSFTVDELSASSAMTASLGSSTGGSFIDARINSRVSIPSGKLAFSGSAADTIYVSIHSYVSIGSSVTITGSVSNAHRYTVGVLSMLNVNGGGANRIPGATAGVMDNAGYGVYR